jgi:hypothetical protein
MNSGASGPAHLKIFNQQNTINYIDSNPAKHMNGRPSPQPFD